MNKLSPEQRELLKNPNIVESINGIDIVTIPKNWLDAILSSEQAWRDENAALRRQLTKEACINSKNALAVEVNQKLIVFAKEIIQTSFDGNGVDGFEIQDLGVKYGLLNEEVYDPGKHGEEHLEMMEPGDPIFCYSSILSSLSQGTDQ